MTSTTSGSRSARLHRPVLVASLAFASAVASLVAPSSVVAQQQPIGARASEVNPGTFREGPHNTAPRAIPIGDGNAPTVAHAPTTPLAGPGSPTPDQISGPIGPSDAARVVQAQMPRLRPCYDRARANRPTLAGRVELRFTIDRNGRVTQSLATGMTDTPDVATCLAATLREITFPRPADPTLTLIYPVTFVPPPTAAPARRTPRGRGAVSSPRGAQPSSSQRSQHAPTPRRPPR